MTFEIRTADGRILTVHTIVGEGLSKVVVEEEQHEAEIEHADEDV